MSILFIIIMGTLARLSGNGFGAKWNMAWLPEVLFSAPFGMATAWATHHVFDSLYLTAISGIISFCISYAGMQSGTWMFLRWYSHDDPNTKRKSTLKPLIDFIASIFGYKLGDEGYAWTAAAIKGFIISLPVGGTAAFFWPLGYEIGSHAKGTVEKYGIDPHAISEFMSGVAGAISILLFIFIVLKLEQPS